MIDALVIVDMQKYFLDQISTGTMSQNRTAATKLVGEVNKQATWAMEKGLPIIVLEYETDGETEDGEQSRTDWRIRRNLQFYKKKWYALKNQDDGSDEVLEVMHGCMPRLGLVERRKLVNLAGRKDSFTFRICGVNLDCCVHDTARGLLRAAHRVEIVNEASRNVWNRATAITTRGEAGKLRNCEGYKIVKNVA